MDNIDQIQAKLAKIKTLFEDTASTGEQVAAQAAMNRLQQRIDACMPVADAFDPPEEFRFSIHNPWSMRLFLALCRSKGLKPYRYVRMRHTSICVRIGRQALDTNLWPEFEQMDALLTRHLNELANQIISDCINPDSSDADMVKALPGG